MMKIVMWHGWGMHPAVWKSLADALTPLLPEETVFVAQPLPGYAGTAEEENPLSSWADVLVKKNDGPFVLAGWSMGAMLAIQAAALFPEKISKLVLFGATPAFAAKSGWPHGVDENARKSFRSGIHADPAAALKRFAMLFCRKDKNARGIVRELSGLEIPPVPVLDAGLDYLDSADFRENLAAVRQETLIIHGAHDPLMPAGAAEFLAKKIPSARLHVLPDASHAPFLSDPAECARIMAQFLKGV